MRSYRPLLGIRATHLLLVLLTLGSNLRADVFSSEFFSDPLAEGWDFIQEFCNPTTWSDGWYHQVLDFEACGPPPGGGQASWVRSVEEFNGVSNWYSEFRVETTGPSSELPGQAPAPVTAGNFFGVRYGVTVSADKIKFLRDVDLPILFIDVEQVPHTIRLELHNGDINTYVWYLDGKVIDEGEAEGPFPAHDAILTWRGKAWFVPNETSWDYFRYGDIPLEGSGDFDSDGDTDSRDMFYFAECVAERGNGPAVDADPGCPWADMDADGDVDFADFAAFQRAFAVTGELAEN